MLYVVVPKLSVIAIQLLEIIASVRVGLAFEIIREGRSSIVSREVEDPHRPRTVEESRSLMHQLGSELHAVTAARVAHVIGILPVPDAIRFRPLVGRRARKVRIVGERDLRKTEYRRSVV